MNNKIINEILRIAYKAVPKNCSLDGAKLIEVHDELKNFLDNNQDKIIITEDSESEMLKIETENQCLFEGNYWDFNRNGKSFKQMFESLQVNVELIEKFYDEWY